MCEIYSSIYLNVSTILRADKVNSNILSGRANSSVLTVADWLALVTQDFPIPSDKLIKLAQKVLLEEEVLCPSPHFVSQILIGVMPSRPFDLYLGLASKVACVEKLHTSIRLKENIEYVDHVTVLLAQFDP